MDAPRRLLGKRSRWPIALGLGVAVVGLCTYLLFTPRQFGFVGRYHGQRVPMPRFATDMARSLTDTMVELAPKKDRANLVKKAHADIDSAIKEEEARTEFYVFNDDPHKVLGAMTHELESCGLTRDPSSVDSIRDASRTSSAGKEESADFTLPNGTKASFYLLPADPESREMFGVTGTCMVTLPHAKSLWAKVWPAIKNPS